MSGGLGNVALYQQTLDNVRADRPDFHFDLGDTFWTDGVTGSTAANQRYLAQRQWMGVVNHSSPVFLAPGNHENEEGWNFDDAKEVLPNSGHLRIPVSPSHATVDYVQTNGAGVAYTYQIVSVNPAVTISRPGTQPKLDWPATSVDHYAVYRSPTAPYFTPSAGTLVADLAPGIHTYADSTADLTQAGSYYYVVASMSASDALVGVSNRTGVFVFSVVPGVKP